MRWNQFKMTSEGFVLDPSKTYEVLTFITREGSEVSKERGKIAFCQDVVKVLHSLSGAES